MTERNYYKTIETEGVAEFKDRGSKFLAYAFPVHDIAEFKLKLGELKKEHSKAVHFCFAYRLGLDMNNFRSSDDGEPSGSAGKPILGQIDSKELTNLAVIVVRYFGGTLLGVPGLINAYKTSAAMVLQVIPHIQKPVMAEYKLEFDYTLMNEVMTVVKQCNGEVLKQEMQLFCNFVIGVPKTQSEIFELRVKDLYRVEIEPNR